MKKLILSFVALFSFATAAQAELQWQSTGPGGGGAFASPAQSAAGTIMVGSDLSGVYRSTDSGAIWQVLGIAHGLTTTHVDSVAFDPAQDGVVLLAAEDGLYRSADCGKAKNAPCNFRRMLSGYATAVAMGQGAAYIAGINGFCQQGQLLARSSDSGATWAKAQAQGLPKNSNIMAIRPQPGNAKTLIVISSPYRFANPGGCGDRWAQAAPARAYLSVDGGDHFTPLDVKPASDSMMQHDSTAGSWPFTADAAFDLADPKRIWLAVAPDQAKPDTALDDGEVWISDGASGLGQGFKRISTAHTGQIWPLKDGSIRLVDIRRQRPWNNKPYAESDDTGFWQMKADGTATQVTTVEDYKKWDIGWSAAPHNPQGSLNGNLQTFFFADDNTAWWVDDQFIYRTSDGGKTIAQQFTNRVDGGFVSRQFDNAVPAVLEPAKTDANTLYAGYFDMGCWITNAALSPRDKLAWTDCNGPESNPKPGEQLQLSPLNGWWNGYGGNTTAMAASPTDAKTFWAVHSSHSFEQGNDQAGYPKITKTTDGFKTYAEVTGNLTKLSQGTAITDLETDGKRVFAAAGNKLFRLDDGAKDWAQVKTPCDGGIQMLGLRAKVMVAGGAKGVCFSGDAGATWAAWKNGNTLGTPRGIWWGPFDAGAQGVTDFAFASADGTQIFMTVMSPSLQSDSSFAGLWKSVDGGQNWTQVKGFASGPLESNFARSVAVNPKNPKMIVVGTSTASVAGGYTTKVKNSGAFVSRDGGATWTGPENNGLAFPFITRLRFTSGGERLFGISPGQGIVFADAP